MNPAIGYAAITVVAVASALIGFYGLRVSRTTSDFYVASRTVRPWWNASAIGGEYLSAASFLGIAGLILLTGSAALWFPIGYTAGYLMLLLFVAAPLRRSGAYTIPDFTEARLESGWARRVTSLLVIVIGWFYIVPQLQGAALTVRITTGLPAWAGSLAVAVIVAVVVAAGGMRSITFVQAFQFWLKLTALAVPVIALLLVVNGGEPPAQLTPADAFPPAAGPGDLDGWRWMYDVNVLGLVRVTKALLPALRASGDAVIINVGSTAGRWAYEGGAGYTAAKHGVKVVSETLRLELNGEPVRISEVAPGMVRTDEFSLVRFGGDQERADAVYAGVDEPLLAEDVADAIAWVATRPSHVDIDELVIKPRAQAAAHKVHRS